MAPSAAPFFIGYWRDTRRVAAIAVLVLIYVAIWAAIGLALDALMNQVMLPASWQLAAAAIGVAAVYAFTPWGRWARTKCRDMCATRTRDGAVTEALSYSASCVVCSAAIMAAVMVIGMSSVLVLVAGAAVMLAYKLI